MEDAKETIGAKNVSLNYQISPLEYTPRKGDEITLPHDNLPPYLKVYIWECTELTDEEREITQEKEKRWYVTFLGNGGTPAKKQFERADG